MAARTAGGGRWEVVKKGRRPGAGGSGRGGGVDRRALGEANGVCKYDLTREYPPGAPPPGPGPAPPGGSPAAELSRLLQAELSCRSAPPGSASATLALSLLSLINGRQREGGCCPGFADE